MISILAVPSTSLYGQRLYVPSFPLNIFLNRNFGNISILVLKYGEEMRSACSKSAKQKT